MNDQLFSIPSYHVSFVIRKPRKGKNKGSCMVYCRITVNGQRASTFSTGQKVYIKDWKGTKSFVKYPRLVMIERQAERLINHLIDRAQPFTANTVKELLTKDRRPPKMFSESLNDLIEKKRQGIGRAITQSTFNGIEDRGQNLLNFLRETNRQNLLLEAVDAGILENLVDWCLAKGWSNSFTRKVVNLAKQVVKNAVLNGDINHNRVSGFTHQADQPKYPEYLTKGQIAQLAAITFKEDERTLEKVRDAALFQCYTSFDYADLVQFDHSQHLYYDETGQAWLKKPRAKRQIKLKEGQEILVPITAELQSLLKKYDLHSPLHFPERKKHPYLSYNHYSLYLKALSKITGIDSLRKSKNLRKTFGMIQLNRGLTIESVSRMMGHQSIKITQQIYAKVDTSRLRNELQKFLQA